MEIALRSSGHFLELGKTGLWDQQRAGEAYLDVEGWTAKSIRNTASSGRFSTDRTMQEYNADIWRLEPIELSKK